MKSVIPSLLCGILLLYTNQVNSQLQPNIKFENISFKDGLSQSSPNCIIQDSRGLLWIGTEDGLNKYDGYTFTIYKPDPDNPKSISNIRIKCLLEDASGNIWIGTNGSGIDLYDRKQDCFIRHGLPDKNSPQSGVITCMTKPDKKNLWIGTNVGLFKYDIVKNSFKSFKRDSMNENTISNDFITCMNPDKDGYVWIGTEYGLNRMNVNKEVFTKYFHDKENPNTLSDNSVKVIFKDSKSALWIGTNNGLNLYDKDNDLIEPIISYKQENLAVVDFPITAISEDNNGDLWIATNGGGIDIYYKETGKFQTLRYDHKNPYSLSNNDVLSLYEDRSGIMWVGANGLDKYNPGKDKFVLYDYVPFTSENMVYRHIHSIYEDSYRVLWIASKSDGIHILNRTKRQSSKLVHNNSDLNCISSNKVRIIREYPENTLWVGTEDAGLNRITLNNKREPAIFKYYKYNSKDSNSISSNTVYSIYFDNEGQVWIGTDNGISKLSPETGRIKRYIPDPNDPASLNNNIAYYIYGDSKENIWVATDNGLNLYDRETDGFKHFVHQPGNPRSLSSNELLTVVEDRKGILWIGTYAHGINRLDTETGEVERFSDIENLRTAVIYGILKDNAGNLWLSTNNGILEFNHKKKTVRQFSIDDGLQSNEFNGGAYFESYTGEMFFGGQYGFNSFYPGKVKIDTVAPIIILTDLKVNNKPVKPGRNSPIKQHISEVKELVFDYSENNFMLTFAALHYGNTSQNKYQYKLEGFDKEWINAGSQRFVSYTRLPYKTFVLRIIASNSDGYWNNEGLSIKIRIKPPFWATLWFRFLAILFVIAIILIIIRNRLNFEQNQKKRLEKEIEESRNELDIAQQQLEKQKEEITVQRQEIRLREKEQQDIMWYNEGLSIFSDIMSKNRGDTRTMLQKTITRLVSYLEAEQGGIYVLNDDNEDEIYLDLIVSYAYPVERLNCRFLSGEGYVGTCFNEGKVIEINNLERSYTSIKSGLGQDFPKYLALVPVKIDEIEVGVIELASFKKLKGYKVAFVQKVSESLASMISSEKSSEKMMRLVEQSRIQAEELAEQEEEMRQNLEEMVATQEESSRREEDLIKQAEEFASHEILLQEEIETLKAENEELKEKVCNMENAEKGK